MLECRACIILMGQKEKGAYLSYAALRRDNVSQGRLAFYRVKMDYNVILQMNMNVWAI